MSIILNSAGKAHATALVDAGKVDMTSSWSFSASDGNALLGSKGDDWKAYGDMHLGIDTQASEKTKDRYAYPVGKGGKVYRSGVIAAKQRAAQQKDAAIETAATVLLQHIDGDGKSAARPEDLRELLIGRGKREEPQREVFFDRATVKEDARTVELAFSSEEPVMRGFGSYGWNEILSHAKGAADMARFQSGRANLLVNHNPNDWVGVIESARIDGDKVGRAVVRFGSSDRANQVFRDVKDGILSSVSVGYSRDEMALTRSGADIPDEYTVTRWTPLEASLVTVPADQTVGVGRAAEEEVPAREERVIHQPARPAETTEVRMQATTEAPAAAAAAAAEEAARRNISAADAEKERIQAIRDLCKANSIDARVEDRWIRDGAQLTKVASELLEVLTERGKQKPLEAARLGLERGEAQRWSLFKALGVLHDPANPRAREAAAFEIECSEALRTKLGRAASRSIIVPSEILERKMSDAVQAAVGIRAMDTTPGSKGGYLVAVNQGDFIGILRNRSVAMRMGARVLSGLQGNVVFPRQTGKPSITWQGGGGTGVTAADQTLGQLSITPKTAIAITDVSLQLMQQASPSAEAFVMADLAADIAIDGVDNATINGTGGAQPLGIKNTTGVTTGQDASSATYAKILAFPQTAGTSNAILGNPGFVTNTAGAARLMQVQRFTSTDTPLWVGNLLDGTCVGFNAMSSEQLASGNLVFGSWDALTIAEWGVLELDTDTGGTRFNQAQVGIRALWMVDVLLRYPQAFVVGTNLS